MQKVQVICIKGHDGNNFIARLRGLLLFPERYIRYLDALLVNYTVTKIKTCGNVISGLEG